MRISKQHFWREAERSYLVRWQWADSEKRVLDSLANLPSDLCYEAACPIDFTVHEQELILFDSAESGTKKLDDSITIFLEPAQYKVRTCIYQPDAKISLILHRFDIRSL